MQHLWSLWQGSKDIPWHTKGTSGVVGLTVLQPKFFKDFPNARFHFKSVHKAQQGTFKGVWLNEDKTEWALERLQPDEQLEAPKLPIAAAALQQQPSATAPGHVAWCTA